MKIAGEISPEISERIGLSILVVDDSELIRKGLSDLLSESEFIKTIMTAKDSEEALSIYKDTPPDIVILDIRIPGDNGIKTLEKMRLLNKKPVFIMLTNYPYEQYRKKCLESGADYFLSKSDEFEKIPDLFSQIAENMTGVK